MPGKGGGSRNRRKNPAHPGLGWGIEKVGPRSGEARRKLHSSRRGIAHAAQSVGGLERNRGEEAREGLNCTVRRALAAQSVGRAGG